MTKQREIVSELGEIQLGQKLCELNSGVWRLSRINSHYALDLLGVSNYFLLISVHPDVLLNPVSRL